ncbi:MAG: 30S ribosome-binding factor RbfA [Armatimonadota bacterium]
MTTRQERINEMLKIEVSDIIRRELKDPRLGFITITGAEVSKDLRHAKIFISVMGDENQKQETFGVLQRASGFIRSEFSKRATMKMVPAISFRMDSGVEQGARIFELLQKVKSDEPK